MDLYSWILTLGIISGQIIKLPIFQNSGITMLDIAVLGLCCFGLFRLKFKLKKPSLVLTGALIFIFIAILSLILTPLHLTPMQYLSSFLYTIRFSAYILLGWEIYSGAYPLLKNRIPQILITSGVSLAILGLFQFIFLPDLGFLSVLGWDPHYFRVVSTFLDPNFAGAFFVLTLLLLFKNSGQSKNWFIYFALVYISLLATFSRGSYLAFLGGFTTLSFLHKSFKTATIGIILFLGLLIGFYSYNKTIAGPRGVDKGQSAQARLRTWQQGSTLFQTHLILGVGFNAYQYALKQYKLSDGLFLLSKGSSTNDSSLLYVAATTGIIGLAFFLFFLSSMFYAKKHNPQLLAGILALIVQGIFINALFYPFILIWLVLMFSKSK